MPSSSSHARLSGSTGQCAGDHTALHLFRIALGSKGKVGPQIKPTAECGGGHTELPIDKSLRPKGKADPGFEATSERQGDLLELR